MRVTRWIHIDNYDIGEAEDIIADLGDILKGLDIDIKITETSLRKKIEFSYDTEKIKKKLSRGAGAHRKLSNTFVTIEDVKNRMNNGETAEQIAKDLGISRVTLFRRLKEMGDYGDMVF